MSVYTSTTQVSNVVQAAYDRYVEFALRAQPLHRGVADKRPAQLAMPGSSVTFDIYGDLAAATATITETANPNSVGIPNTSTVSVTLNEYGNTVTSTRKLSALAFTDVDPAIANLVAFNMADSIDKVVVAVAIAGTNVLYNGGATSTVTVAGTSTYAITGAIVRKANAKLRTGNAVPRLGNLFGGYIHPEVAHDLRAESGAGAWEDIRKYTDDQVGSILNGVLGVVHGCYWVETPRAYNATDGATAARNFRTLIFGQQALAEAVAVEPGIVIGPVIDPMLRLRPISWYGLLGWSIFRQASLYRLETTSTIDNS